MTTSSGTERDRAETEAATWLVLLAEDPEDRDLARRFESWHAASPLNAELWARTKRAYELAGKAPSTSGTVVSLPRRLAMTGATTGATTEPRAKPRRRLVTVAAALAVAACLLVLAAPPLLLRLQADHVTATAELRSLTLEDGTQVRLGPESAFSVDYVSGQRRVRLLKGQAFFDVVPDTERPFRVTAGEVVTTVLGTAFEVTLGTEHVDVAVKHGLVRVDGGSPPLSEKLSAGDWLSVGQGSGVSRSQRNVDDIGDWMTGELVARDRPMTEILDALRRYYSGVILVQDSAFARTRVTGIYDLRDPAATLASLTSSHGANLHRVSPWLLVVTSK